MSQYVPIETPGGLVFVEVEGAEESGGINLVSARGKFPTFEEATASLKANAKYILDLMKELAPSEVEVSCGIKVGAEAGNAFWGLASTSGEATYTVTLKWEAGKDEVTV